MTVIVNILYSGLGGHSSVVFSFIEADVRKEYEHIVIFYGIEDMPQSYIDKCKELGARYHFVKKVQGLDIASQKNVVNVLKEVNPGIIMLHSVNLILPVYRYVLGKKATLITIEHQPNHLKTKREWVWSYLLMLLSKKVVYLTDLYGAQMKERLGFAYNSSKVSIINNGINTKLFKPLNEFQSESMSIGMLARLSSTKDHLTLVEAFGILIKRDIKFQGYRLKIAGDGDMKAAIVKKIDELDLSGSVDMLGMLPEHMNPEFLNMLTIYVHASLGETMSTSLMQAMACGKAIIASDVEGINNMISDNHNGMLVEPENKVKLADKMEQLLSDEQLRFTLAQNALQNAKLNFTNEVMFNAYRKLF